MRVHALRATVAMLAAALLAALIVVLPTNPAHAAGRVDVSTTPAASGATKVTLSGSGFQYQPNAPGGVYVFFGTVADPATNSWAPSQGGKSGSSFTYAGTSGAQLLVGFEGGSSASASNSVIRADGTWSSEMTIPGATFAGSSGNPHEGAAATGAEINCLEVQCGIITIGAHGRINANNESFTPISFVTESGEIETGTAAPSFDDDATKLDIPSTEEEAESENTAAGEEVTEEDTAAAPNTEALADTSNTSTWVVLGVVAFAVLALIGALVFYIVNRNKQKKTAAAGVVPADTPNEGEAS
ncbi:MAG: hypothetical protein ACTHYD_08380 [Canibacter sp.]